MTTVALVDDHESFRAAIAVVLSLEPDLDVVVESARGDAVDAVVEAAPDVVVVDLDLPGDDGVAVVTAVRAAGANSACVVLTASRDPVELGRAVEAGAAAVLHKSVGVERLLEVVRRVAVGDSVLDPVETSAWLQALATSRSAAWHARAVAASLSPREQQLLELLVRGGTTTAIAHHMSISVPTVQTHIRNLLGKLGVGSRLEAVTEAIRLGLVDPHVEVPRLPDPR